jgi:hypothetical protein
MGKGDQSQGVDTYRLISFFQWLLANTERLRNTTAKNALLSTI